MSKKLLITLAMIIILGIKGYSVSNQARFFSQHHRQDIIFENYTRSDNGSVGMAGLQFNTFFGDHYYYSLSVLEAVGGHNRAGYAVAGIGLGAMKTLATDLTLEASFVLGAGGGGHLKKGVGGGLSLKTQAGLYYRHGKEIGSFVTIGWIDFPDGNLSSPIYTLGVSWYFTEYRRHIKGSVNE